MKTQRPKSDTLGAMGLQAFMDKRYYRYGGYMKLVEMIEADKDNGEIARVFGLSSRSTPRNWRVMYETEKQAHGTA